MWTGTNIIVMLLAFLVGAWVAAKYPQANLLGKLTG